MKVFRTMDFDNSGIRISDEEYSDFCGINGIKRYLENINNEKNNKSSILITGSGMEIVMEEELENAYIMVDAKGMLVDNSGDKYEPILNCAAEDFAEGFKRLSLDRDLYFSRYAK